VPGPSRFTMLVTKRGDEWRIAHHHSSPHVIDALKCPLLAQSGHHDGAPRCPLSEVKRTSVRHAAMSANGSKAEVPALRPACWLGEVRSARSTEPITN